jgi:hypothetical protein
VADVPLFLAPLRAASKSSQGCQRQALLENSILPEDSAPGCRRAASSIAGYPRAPRHDCRPGGEFIHSSAVPLDTPLGPSPLASPAPLPRLSRASPAPLGVSRLSRSDRPDRRLHRPSPPPPHTTPPHTTTTTTADDDDDDDDDDDEDDGKRARGPPIATLYFPRPLHIPLLCHIARLAVLASLPADFYPRCRILAPIDLG